MANKSDFYLILPSNADEEGNMTNQFRVRLPDPIELNGNWEVALVEITYPYTWPNLTGLPMINVPMTYEDIKLYEPTTPQLINANNVFLCAIPQLTELETVVVPPGHYSTPEELLKAIKKGLRHQTNVMKNRVKLLNEKLPPDSPYAVDVSTLPTLDKAISFSYDSVLRRVKVDMVAFAVDAIIMARHLEYMLGVEPKHKDLVTIGKSVTLAPYPVDLKAGFYSLFIYCDLVETQILGKSRVQLLQIVPIEGKYEDIVSKTFFAPHYIPVLKKTFESVEIAIKDDTDKLVPFEYGKCMLKLHFRKKRAIPL